jgi:hypothetical protein
MTGISIQFYGIVANLSERRSITCSYFPLRVQKRDLVEVNEQLHFHWLCEGRLAWHQPNYCKVEVINAHEILIMKCRCKQHHKDYFRIIAVRYNFWTWQPWAEHFNAQVYTKLFCGLVFQWRIETTYKLQPSANEAQLTATRLSNPWNVLGELATSPQI